MDIEDTDDSSENYQLQSIRGEENETSPESEQRQIAEKNLKELYELHNEATQIIVDKSSISEGWYEERFVYIYKYSQLNWQDLADKFRYKDNIVYDLAVTINLYIDELMGDYGGKPTFEFAKYYTVLCSIINIWQYYNEKYIGGETDSDMLDLIEGMTFL
jgi:hypothetical protein